MEFVANRLSSGNRVFPDKVKIEDTGVTLRSPSLFSGKEHTLMYHQISSISTENPMLGFTSVVFRTLSNQRIECKGFTKADADEIKRIVQSGIQASRGSGGGMGSFTVDNSHVEAMRIKAEADKANAEVEQRKLSLDETKNRQQRADELRSQGKGKQAFFVEHQKVIAAVGTGILVAIILTAIFVGMNVDRNKVDVANVLDNELAQKEEHIEMLIHNGQNDEAIQLIETLQHDSHELSEHKKGFMDFYTYSEYWKHERDKLREKAFKGDKSEDTPAHQVTKATPAITDTAVQVQNDNDPLETDNVYTIKSEKAYFYNEPNADTKRKGYLISGQEVISKRDEGGFLYVNYTNEKGVTTTGWILKVDVQ
jgi:hypothetical protein